MFIFFFYILIKNFIVKNIHMNYHLIYFMFSKNGKDYILDPHEIQLFEFKENVNKNRSDRTWSY